MEKVTLIRCEGRTFIIAKDDQKRFWAFESKYVGEKGELLKAYNGIDGFMDTNVNKTIQRVRDYCHIQKRVSETGMTVEQAVMEMMHKSLRKEEV